MIKQLEATQRKHETRPDRPPRCLRLCLRSTPDSSPRGTIPPKRIVMFHLQEAGGQDHSLRQGDQHHWRTFLNCKF